ncbi:hypothetical protein EVAR_80082_1 [Eumeta japonica]|uniref:Uncharacterized protein n=1 Tax=Eumeta variegata TaxID=151549 RepID=A0A4C1UD01_EUMVA|nr:hypothetical protein EVAR_80082_1 [Eumeta japonica]
MLLAQRECAVLDAPSTAAAGWLIFFCGTRQKGAIFFSVCRRHSTALKYAKTAVNNRFKKACGLERHSKFFK